MTFIKHLSCIRFILFYFLAKTETLAFFFFSQYWNTMVASLLQWLYSTRFVCVCDHLTQRLHLYFNIIGHMHYRSWFHFSIKNTPFRSKPLILWGSFLEVWYGCKLDYIGRLWRIVILENRLIERWIWEEYCDFI